MHPHMDEWPGASCAGMGRGGGHGRGHGHGRGRGHGQGHGRGRGGGGFGRRGGGRVFGPGDLRLVLLALVAEQPRHGYELIKEIEDLTGGEYSPSPGVIYPTLSLLEETSMDRIFQGGLHEFLTDLIARNNALGAQLASDYHFS